MSCARRYSVIFTVLLTCTLTAILAAQGAGYIAGRVVDSTARPVPGATVQLLGTSYSARTREDGSFRIDNLPLGSYRLRGARLGFAPDSIVVTVAQ
ncbi:MAG TPA: carboxypeptidase-like regulatory domain-containing protein, partial [Gemmatimonadales bacterium]|nr:carboxypeptidase-like regulatory domain-containing protein [Gemmatimonadales bacterium]